MGTSNWQNISYNIELIKKLDPKSILDIGVGFGRWGFLFREYLEIWGDRNYSGKWNRVIDGVEIFPDYIKSYHKYFYDNIYIIDALEFLRETNRSYDLINCGDVIEHFYKKEAFELIDISLKKSKFVLINIPIGNNWQQGPINNNEFERHKSTWHNSDFVKYKHLLLKKFKDIELRNFSVVLLSNEKIDYTKAYGKYFTIKNILKNKFGMDRAIKKIKKRNA